MRPFHTRADSAAQDIMHRVASHVTDWLRGDGLHASELHGSIRDLIHEVIRETEQDVIALHTVQNEIRLENDE
jgi:hypothetical protein